MLGYVTRWTGVPDRILLIILLGHWWRSIRLVHDNDSQKPRTTTRHRFSEFHNVHRGTSMRTYVIQYLSSNYNYRAAWCVPYRETELEYYYYDILVWIPYLNSVYTHYSCLLLVHRRNTLGIWTYTRSLKRQIRMSTVDHTYMYTLICALLNPNNGPRQRHNFRLLFAVENV